ncbi:hypothetical protein J27TS8_19830 [Robertmurraya siralis]|uniref:Uncharacterized protein n=1 Tax=Robertmurraya siralis TaxID=77777 RepID=A0A919WHG1_9BACI|nr:hypothetical protein [Robertmurraya siralis]PAE18662.1 hypothetical protein CHH80_20475 [Bacillus sp. 7504-2]GIN61990.1 hypothetical protein J27TS8_19830 [Robertmurraya siralis]
MLKRIRNKINAIQEAEMELDNIYTILPPPGTIIGEATEEEMEKAAELEIKHMAFIRLQDMNIHFEGASYRELLRDFQEFETESSQFWRGVAKRLAVPYEWPIRIDHANGPIYLGEHEIIEELEEERAD